MYGTFISYRTKYTDDENKGRTDLHLYNDIEAEAA